MMISTGLKWLRIISKGGCSIKDVKTVDCISRELMVA
jgi:hypothetical protein